MDGEHGPVDDADQDGRRYPASRLRPRHDPGDEATPPPPRGGPGPMGSWFGPQTFAGGRVRVFGCSPGCLLVSLVLSLVLTLVLNLVLNAF